MFVTKANFKKKEQKKIKKKKQLFSSGVIYHIDKWRDSSWIWFVCKYIYLLMWWMSVLALKEESVCHIYPTFYCRILLKTQTYVPAKGV